MTYSYNGIVHHLVCFVLCAYSPYMTRSNDVPSLKPGIPQETNEKKEGK